MEPASILQSVIDVFMDKSSVAIIPRIGALLDAKEEINKMSRTLLRINAMLKDTEERGAEDQRVKAWLGELKDVAYDVDDMLEEFQYADLQSQLEGSPPEGILNKVSSLFCSAVDEISRKTEIAAKINNLRVRIDEIAQQGKWFTLGEFGGVCRHERSERLETSSLITDRFKMFGRDDDKEAVIKLLMTASGEKVSVIPIVGMGGLGKTTLAQHVYNDDRVKSYFDIQIWVCVSIGFNLKSLTREILQCTGGDSSSMNLDSLQIKLMEKLDGKRFLIVLDDVWIDNPKQWDHLRAPFTVGAEGSKFIVTTRRERVSQMMSSNDPYILKFLPEDAVWSLFVERAFANKNPNEHLIGLVAIGKQIIEKCKGLPLAANSLGDLLRFKRERHEWLEIQESEVLSHVQNDILPVLRLSYLHLPPNLKRCFAYCSLFPKGFLFTKDDLVLKWMAANFVESTGPKSMEEMGREYFDDLCLRSFFYAHQYKSSTYNMHDIIHDLSHDISGSECVKMSGGRSPLSISEKARHASLVYMNPTDLKFSNRCTSLRSLVLLNQLEMNLRVPIEPVILTDLFTNLPHLRVLDLNNNYVTNLPDSIGNLKHLRYLNLSYTNIESLPESITMLYRLQTLKLGGTEAAELPKGITKLINLRNLELNGKIWSKCTPSGLGKLANLQTLESIIVDEESGQGIRELKDMNFLSGALKILKLENVVDAEEAKLGELRNKKRLLNLSLQWNEGNSLPHEVVTEVLECLQPHTNLQELCIIGYSGVRFPNWIHNSCSNLVHVTLSSCKCCDVLPSLGKLPFLKILKISEMDGLKKVGREFCGDGKRGFPSLEELDIRNMNSLEVWSDVVEGDYPKLSILGIWGCPKLKVLPHLLPALINLILVCCNNLVLQSLHFYCASLQNLEIGDFSKLKSLPDYFFEPLTSLQKFTIADCKQITSLAEKGLENLTSLRYLSILSCDNLTSFPERIRDLSSLQVLHIFTCGNLLSLPDECLPTTLTNLTVFQCANLNSLPKGLHNLTSLITLKIAECPQLKSLPEDGLPTTLQELHISDCSKLEERYQGGERHKVAPNTRVFLNSILINPS